MNFELMILDKTNETRSTVTFVQASVAAGGRRLAESNEVGLMKLVSMY
jgi:hypothetical protein